MNFRLLLFLLFLFVVTSVVAAPSPELTLEAYYDAFAAENVGEYLETQVLDPAALDEQKVHLRAIFENVDVLEYDIKGLTVDEEGEIAIAKYRLYSKMKIAGETVEDEVPVAALLVRDGDWKIILTGDSQFVHSMMRQYIVQEETAEDLLEARSSGDVVEVEIPVETDIEEAPDEVTGGDAECGYDAGKFKGSQSLADFHLPSKFTKLFSQGTKIKMNVGSATYYGVVKGKDIAFGSEKTHDYMISTDECTMSYLLDSSVDALAAYKAGALQFSAKGGIGKAKIGIAKTGLWFSGLFKPVTKEFSIEAEEGVVTGGASSYVASSSRGPGELYLGEVSSAKYTFDSPITGTAKLYLRVSDDGKHPDGARSVLFTINGREKEYEHEAAVYTPWGWEELGVVWLEEENELVISKEKATSAAFVLDRMRFVEE